MTASINSAALGAPNLSERDAPGVKYCPSSTAMTREEFAKAYDKGHTTTTRFLISRGIAPETAEEASQEAWAKGWEHRDKLRNNYRLLSWVNTIALNVFRNSFRRRETGEPLPEIAISPRIGAKTIDVQRALEKCPPADREILEKHYLAGYTSMEIAKEKGCTPVAIRVRLLRVRRRIRKTIGH